MIYTHWKKLLAIGILIILIITGIIAYSLTRPQAPKDPNPAAEKVDTYTVKGIAETPIELPKDVKDTIQTLVNNIVTSKHGEVDFVAQIRKDSFDRAVTVSGGIKTTILIDVTPLNETYRFTSAGTEDQPYGSMQMHCAPEDQQMIHPSTCKDATND